MSIALKRLTAEYKQLSRSAPEGIMAGPVDDSNFFEWEALIVGPNDTPYQGGLFSARLTFPPDYPHSPPAMRFVTKIFHPNIYLDGRVCISILHPAGSDPIGYEDASERWSPVQSIEKILLSVVSLLSEPNCDSAANLDAAILWRQNREKYDEIVRNCVQESLAAQKDKK
ncbi:Ubiquitin-conjugating enzyme E2 G2 [Hymenolepis weldensis]